MFHAIIICGGVNTLKTIEQIIKIGVEKVYINTAAIFDPNFIKDAKEFGSSTICCCIDYKTDFFNNHKVYVLSIQQK